MNRIKVLKKVLAKLSQTQNTYTKNDIANLAKKMKESNPKDIENIWFDFQNKFKITKEKTIEILIDKLKVIYQVDLKSKLHAQKIDALISEIK